MSNGKIRVRDQFSSLNLSGSFQGIINVLQLAQQAEADGSWEKLEIDWGIDDGSLTGVGIIGYRWETDREQEQRLKQKQKDKAAAAKRKATMEAEEKKLYEQLKKKFGDK